MHNSLVSRRKSHEKPDVHTETRALLAMLLALLLGALMCACGSSDKLTAAGAKPTSSAEANGGVAQAATPTTTPIQSGRRSDKDHDNTSNGYYDFDDAEIMKYGRPASPSEMRQAAALIKRYYTAALAGDGAAGCALSYSLYSEAVAENARNARGLRGETCAAAMSGLFKRERAQIAVQLARLHVIGMRVEGNRGYVLLGERAARTQRYLFVHRESGAWKAEAVVATELG